MKPIPDSMNKEWQGRSDKRGGRPEDEPGSALTREQTFTSGLLESYDGIAVIVDGAAKIQRCNDAFARVARKHPADLQNALLEEVFPSDGATLRRIVQQALAHGRVAAQVDLAASDRTQESGADTSNPLSIDPDTYAITGVALNAGSGGDGAASYVVLSGGRLSRYTERLNPTWDHEQKYQLLAEHVADVISRHAVDTSCLFVSPSVQALLGLDVEDLIGQRVIDRVHPEDRARVAQGLDAAMRGQVAQGCFRIRHAHGHYIWVEATSQLRFDPGSGAPIDLVVSTREVTERVEAEEALQKSETRFRQMAENVAGLFFLCTPSRLLYVNPAYETMWGEPVHTLYRSPRSFLRAVDPSDRNDVQRHLRQIGSLAPGASYRCEFRIRPTERNASEDVRWIRSVCTRIADATGEEPRFAGYAVDITLQKQQEEETHRSKERWQRLVESHMDPILISVDGRVRYINPSGASLLGGETPQEVIGQRLVDLVEPSFHAELRDRAARVYAGESTDPFEQRIRRLDGETRVVVSQSAAIEYDGQPAAQTVIRDVTEWREAQSKLEYRVLVENLIVDLSTKLIDTRADDMDEAIAAALSRIGPLVGCDRGYVVFTRDQQTYSQMCTWSVFESPSSAPSSRPPFEGVASEDLPWFFDRLHQMRPLHIPRTDALPPEARALRAMLGPRDVKSFIAVPMSEGLSLMGFVCFESVRSQRTWEDETIVLLRVLGDTFSNSLVRRNSELALREREAQYRTVVENVHDVVFQTDTEGYWTFLNPAWKTVTGFPVADSLGMHFSRHIDMRRAIRPNSSSHGRPASLGVRTEILHEGEDDLRFEAPLKGEGAPCWVAVYAQTIRDDDGERAGVVGTLHDVTERRRMEERTHDALQRERELNRLKSSFISMVSHEFRTPLSTIRSSSEMVAQFVEQGDDEKREKYLRRIRRQVDRMTHLLRDVITTSRLDAQRSGPELEATDLRHFMREIAGEMRAHHGADRRLQIQFDAVPDRLAVDPGLLHHILGNLTSNALKYSPPEETVEVDLAVEGERLILRVRDYGIGIPDADLSHLFDAFYRGSNVGNAEGIGLGMTIVQRAVDVYGGSIQYERPSGRGSVFIVTAPTTATSGIE